MRGKAELGEPNSPAESLNADGDDLVERLTRREESCIGKFAERMRF
jgi:hypothetical protein